MVNGESAIARDARVEALWRTLDTDNVGYLDLSHLRAGLREMDHPLKNAHGLLQDVLDAIDINHDGQISYSEFRHFVEQTEKELWALFKGIDRDHNGKLNKDELKSAFRDAGLTVSTTKLESFFDRIDTNHDGEISFEEWRDFLLFIPATVPNLEAVLSYFSAAVRLSPEGDVVISDENVNSLGTTTISFIKPFFRVIFEIAQPPEMGRGPDYDYYGASDIDDPEYFQYPEDLQPGKDDEASELDNKGLPDGDLRKWENLRPVLIACVPKSGYFLAGGLAGAVSRTATAPLDRIKVYLIAQTGPAKQIAEAAKSGAPLAAARGAWLTFAGAVKELWAAGGVRSMFAGNGINVVKVMPESAIKFGTYEGAKRVLAKFEGHNNPHHNSSASKFLAGGISGMASQFCAYPLDTLKFRMQCETVSGGLHGNRLIIATAKKMWQETGFRAFYRGLPMGLVGMFPYAAIDLGTFEYLKKSITMRNAAAWGCHEDDAAPGSFATALIGGFSGALGASMVYPLNVLRTRLQSQGTVMHPRTYKGVIDVFQQTVKGEGVRGLFKGLTPNLLKVVPAVSITYVVYEKTKKELQLK